MNMLLSSASLLSNLFRLVLAVILSALFSVQSVRSTVADEIHVDPQGSDQQSGTQQSPVGTLQRALELARQTNGPDEIHLQSNTWIQLEAPVQLDARDAGLRIIGHGATLSGGLRVTDWQTGSDGIWRARCPVASPPRELFINGQRAIPARWPNTNWLRIVSALPDRRSGFTFASGDLPTDLVADSALELVFLHDWSMSRIAVASLDQTGGVLQTAYPIGSAAPHYAIDHFEKNPRYALERSPQLLDAVGEWAYSDGHLLYVPRPGETPESVEAVVPQLSELFKISGSQQEPVAKIHLSGLTFAHCRFDIPPQGYAEGQATMHDRRDGSPQSDRVFVPAALRVENAEQIRFDDCRFTHLGGSGVWIGQGSADCELVRCEFSDISGNGLNIGEASTENVARQIHVRNCQFHHCGAQFYGAVGVWIAMAANCTIEHCEIQALPYTGISVGWRWNPTPSPCQGHQIVENHIHHVMQVLSDGGGIYTLGRQPGTRLAKNTIHDVPLNAGRAQSNGIFMDEGTSELIVEENTIYNIAKSPIRFHKAGENLIRRNILGITDDSTAFTFNATEPSVITFEQNTERENSEFAK